MPRYLTIPILLSLLVSCGPVSTPSQSVLVTSTALPRDAQTITETITPTSINYDEAASLFEYDKESPVAITENSVQQEDGFTLYDIHYPSPKGGDVPAYLLIPDGAGPFAAILLMHGSSGSRASLLSFAKDLAPTGAVVLTVSGPAARTPNRDWIHFTAQDRDEQIQLIIDLRRAVDLLTQHPNVDASRIGYVGYSYGAAMGGLLAGVEPRVKAYGLMVGDGGLVNHFTDDGKPVGGFETVPAVMREEWLNAMEPIEPIHFIGHASASWLYFQNAHYDSSVSEADALAYQDAGSLPKRVQWYDSGHGLPAVAYVDMVNWLAERIGIDDGKFTGPSQ